jgi:hypothetical protein
MGKFSIPIHWRNRKQYLRLEGIEKVDQKNGIGLAHMRSSPEVIETILKRRALREAQEQKDAQDLETVREQISSLDKS